MNSSRAGAPSGALERIVFEIGQRLGEALLRGVQASAAQAQNGRKGRRGPGRPKGSANGGSCVVPNCGRRSVAKGLCATHYRKARRLNLSETLSAAQLSELAQDGRKTRFGGEAA